MTLQRPQERADPHGQADKKRHAQQRDKGKVEIEPGHRDNGPNPDKHQANHGR